MCQISELLFCGQILKVVDADQVVFVLNITSHKASIRLLNFPLHSH